MGVRNVTGQELHALVSSNAARTPPEGAPKVASAGKKTAPDVHESTEPHRKPARLPANVAPAKPLSERRGTRIHVDAVTDRVVAQILNEKREVIKQIPPEELLKVVANVRKYQGLLFDEMI